MKNRELYSPDWVDTIRPRILRRDQYKCRDCGATQRSIGYYDAHERFIQCDAFMQAWALERGIKLTKVFLQVAHLDQNPANNNDENLKTYCPRHHLRFDREFNAIKRKAARG